MLIIRMRLSPEHAANRVMLCRRLRIFSILITYF
jgi:hypothetical protein